MRFTITFHHTTEDGFKIYCLEDMSKEELEQNVTVRVNDEYYVIQYSNSTHRAKNDDILDEGHVFFDIREI